MKIWKNCIADILYYSSDSATMRNEGYIVSLSDNDIKVAYDDERGAVCYHGKHHGDGHFELTAPERDGRASLHRFPNSNYMEGYWLENNVQGMWRIELK